MRDSRALFENMTHRKVDETTWDLPAQALDDERMGILLKLPRKQVAWESSPTDSIFYKMGEKNSERLVSKNIPLEWVVERMGEGEDQLQYFYVYNEGYDYARYTFRFVPRAV